MEPAVLGGKLTSSLVGSLVKKLFAADGPGAGLVDKPVRLKDLVSFRGEKRTLDEKDVHKLAEHLVHQAADSPGEPPFRVSEQAAVTNALARRLLAFGDLDMDDVHAVRFGHRELAKQLHDQAPATDGLSSDACYFLDSATEWACLQILEFFTRRSTFVARTLVEQTRTQAELIARVDELLARAPRPDHRDTAFERRYLRYVAKKHSKLTIYGIDLSNSPNRWPLDVAYLSLDVVGHGGETDYGPSSVGLMSRPADQALSDHDRVLLRGGAGSGKTTLIQWLAVSASTNSTGCMTYLTGRIPFVLPLRTLTRHGERLPPPALFLSAVGCPLAGTQPEGWENRVLSAGRGLVLVDGIDEVQEPERDRARAWLSDLVEVFPGNRWLVTSRPAAVHEDWLATDGFTELGLSAMGTADVASFIKRWHQAAATGTSDEDAVLASYENQLLDAVRTKPDLGRLATNPLMCGLICALHRDRRGYLPHGRKELYDSALSMLLVRRDRERDMSGPELSEEPQLQLLQRLAHWLIRNGHTEMDQTRAESVIAEILPAVPAAQVLGDARAVLRHFLIRTGLLLSPTPDTIHFVHRTFQDYLGARAAVEAGDFGLLVEHAADDQWADVIRMAVAQARPHERADLLKLLTAAPDKRVHLLAMACLEHATELDPTVRRRVEEGAAALLPPQTLDEARELAEVGPLVLELLPGPEGLPDEQAELVVQTAGLVGTEAAMPLLARYRQHAAQWVRMNLARAWERFDTVSYADEVLAYVDSHDFYINVTSPEALRALPRIGPRARLGIEGPHHIDEVMNVLSSDVEKISLSTNPLLHDLRPLTALRSLNHVGIGRCPEVRDLSPLVELGLHDVYLNDLTDLTGLDRLDTLRSLIVTKTVVQGGLADFPQNAPLAMLGLGSHAFASTGLRGLSQWGALDTLDLREATGPLSSEDWSEIARMPSLTQLWIDVTFVSSSTGIPELPSIESLYLMNVSGAEEISQLSRVFPHLRKAHVIPRRQSLDVTPYAALFPEAEVSLGVSRTFLF
ncbi:NACHT domain-containing protein [Streptomyces sp. NPDC005122]